MRFICPVHFEHLLLEFKIDFIPEQSWLDHSLSLSVASIAHLTLSSLHNHSSTLTLQALNSDWTQMSLCLTLKVVDDNNTVSVCLTLFLLYIIF